MTKKLKTTKEEAVLVAVDFQEKLMPAMCQEEATVEKMARLVFGARVLGLPIIVTTQYAKGLGNTVPKVASALGDFQPIDKNTFSCCENQEFMARLKAENRNTVIITGAEAHICVLQTALDLLEMGYSVQVVADCIDSREAYNKEYAIERLISAGAVITTYETVLYELAKGAREPGFKEISAIVK